MARRMTRQEREIVNAYMKEIEQLKKSGQHEKAERLATELFFELGIEDQL